MQNFKKVFFVFALAGWILACSIASAPTTTAPDQQNVATIVAGTIQAVTAAAPAATSSIPPTQPAPTQAAQPAGIPVSFQNVSFIIPSGLASGASPQAIPNNPSDQNNGPWAVAPAHIEFTLDNYNLPADHFSQVFIDVYPAQEYASMYDGARISLQRLQAILSSPSSPLTNENLPQVPNFNAASMFAAQAKLIQFKNGSGARFVTQYGQAVGPINNSATFYNFEGLTNDGKYYIIVVLPIQAPLLANGIDPNAPLPAGGVPFPDYNSPDATVFNNYYQAITDKMNATSPDSFAPSIIILDALIQSITITP